MAARARPERKTAGVAAKRLGEEDESSDDEAAVRKAFEREIRRRPARENLPVPTSVAAPGVERLKQCSVALRRRERSARRPGLAPRRSRP